MDDQPQSTGIAAVDQVLADVSAVADRPVSDHVEVFERAHDRLRRALDATRDPRPGPVPGGGQGA